DLADNRRNRHTSNIVADRASTDAYRQAARRLRIEQYRSIFIRACGPADEIPQILGVSLASIRSEASAHSFPRPGKNRDRRKLQPKRQIAGASDWRQVAEQGESGNVGRTAGSDGKRGATGGAVESLHGCQHGALRVGGELAALARGGEDSISDRLAESDLVARFGAGIGQQMVGMRPAGDGQAVLQLAVDDGVTTDYQRSGLVDFFLAAEQDSAQDLEGKLAGRECDNVQSGQRLSAHRVDIRQGIRGGDLAEVERIVDDGRKKVHRLNQREIIRDAKHTRVVEG